VRLGRGKPLALLAALAVLGAALGVPLGSLAYWLAVGSSASFPGTALLHATVASVGYGLVAAVVTTLLALPVALLVVRHRSVASVVIERSTYIARALPGIVVALALVFVSIRVARPLYQTALLLVAAYAILFLPMALIAVRAALVQAPPRLTEVARALGVRPLSVLRRVTLPLIAPGLGAGAALVFLSVVTELTATLLLAPIGTNTLATQVWSNSAELAYGAAAPYAAVMILIAAPATYLLTRPRAGVEVV
jgi:iron(III) transport system permease protein